MLAFSQDMAELEELQTLPTRKAHQLVGDRAGTWSLSVNRNGGSHFGLSWIEPSEPAVCDVDFEDYNERSTARSAGGVVCVRADTGVMAVSAAMAILLRFNTRRMDKGMTES